MIDPWSEFEEVKQPRPAARAKPVGDPWSAFRPARPQGGATDETMAATGQVHDGDTFRLTTGQNARVYGADAFELDQTGRTRSGATVPLGQQARTALLPYAQPDATVTPTGATTYNRPVVTLDRGGDFGEALIGDGLGIAVPEYLKADPGRLADYMEAERAARLNRRGAWSTQFEQPSSYRHHTPDPWAKPEPGTEGNSTAVFWDEPLPAQGLRPEIAKGYLDLAKDFSSTPEQLLGYAKANGFQIDGGQVRKFVADRNRDQKVNASEVSYQELPRVLTDLGDGKLGAGLRGVADPFNVLDEAGALVDTVGGTNGRENLFSSDRRFGDIYANNLDQNRSILANDDAAHPYVRFAGQMAGGLIAPGASVEGVGFSAARNALRTGATRMAAVDAARNAVVRRLGTAGAIEGGIAGAGAGENLRSRATGALIGAPVGLALGVGTSIAAPVIAKAIGKPFSRLAGRDGERTASDFTDGAFDTAKAASENDLPTGGVGQADTMPMRSEMEAPSIVSPDLGTPRQPDRIDVNAGPRPLLDPATDAERRAAAARLNPNDVLPIPANTVDGLEEAARIDAGRFDPVKAPPEDAGLSSNALPNANTGKMLPKRGPADLVTWLRSQGGIKAQGREMEHYGIDNIPRKGMDFAEGENRFGPLVNNDGMTYDDAAHAAWEAGYFPDHTERPDVAEFLDTLNQTHTGNNRAFRAEDLSELDAFHAARRQRGDVLNAQDNGAPLVDDNGQPINMADLEANAPPVHAYEEWGENAPRLAGNIRLDKLDSPQAIKRALVATHQRVGGFDAATRGRITHAETESLATELGMTADDLLKRRKGQALNAEEALAARQILSRSGTDLVNLAKRMQRTDNPGDELEAAFKQAWLRHVAIQEQVSGATAEAGRALSAFRMAADSRSAGGRVLPTLGDFAGGAGRLKDAAEMIVENAGDPGAMNADTARLLKPRFRHKLVEIYYNSLLSGPQTHAVNILSNTMTALGQIPEHAVAAAIGTVRKSLPGQADTDKVLFSELGARSIGLLQGTKEGLRQAARTFATGEPADAVTKVESQVNHAISGIKGSIIRTPTRTLAAEDELFKAMARRMELSGLAVRQAVSEGLKGEAARQRAAEIVANPSDRLLARSFEYGRYVTFQNQLGDVGRHVSAITEAMPGLKLILPFVRTPTNILKFAIERSPGAPLMKEWRRDIAAGGARRDLALAKVMVGTGTAALVLQLAIEGKITGGGPADDGVRKLMLADGWQPYSFKIGDRYYSYSRLDPFSTTLGTAADIVDLQQHMTDKQRDESSLLVATAILHNLSSKTWLSGLSTALDALNDPERSGQSFVSRTLAAIAVPGAVAQLARTADPVLREARDPITRIRSRIPGLSQGLYPRRDVFGKPIVGDGGLGPDIVTPIYTGTANNDPTINALIAAGSNINAPSSRVGGRLLSPSEYDRYQQMVGLTLKPGLDALVRSGRAWRSLSDEQKQKAVQKVADRSRREARAAIRNEASSAADPWSEFTPAH